MLRTVYRSFSVSNFRGIVSAELDDLARINIFTGLNDAGKTSMLEAIFLHASGPLAGISAVQTLRAGRGQSEIALGAEMETPWASLFRNMDMKLPIQMSASTKLGKYSVAIEEAPGSVQLEASGARSDNSAHQSSAVKLTTRAGSGPERSYTQSINVRSVSGSTESVTVDLRLDPPVDTPFSRGSLVRGTLGPDLASGYSSLRKRGSHGKHLIDALKMLDSRIQGLEVLVSDGRTQLHAEIDDVLIPFNLLGDGAVMLARYLVAIGDAHDGIVLLDEVGSGLHFSFLEKMWAILNRAAEHNNVQLFATTHSQESVIAANSALTRPNDLAVYRLRRASDSADIRVARYGGSKLATALQYHTELR